MKLNLKTVLTGGAATIALVAASGANASGYYIGLFGGISTMEDDFNLVTTASTSGSKYTAITKFTVGSVASLPATPLVSNFTYDYTPYQTAATGTRTGITGHYGYAVFIGIDSLTTAAGSTVLSSRVGFDDGWVIGGAIGWDFGNGWRTELEVAYRTQDIAGGHGKYAANRSYTHFDHYGLSLLYGTYSFTHPTYLKLKSHTVVGYTFGTLISTTSNSGTSTAVVKDAGGAHASLKGDLETWSYMFNVWHDFDFGDSPIHPFVGVGVGFAEAKLDLTAAWTATGIANPYSILGTSNSAAYVGNGAGQVADWGFAYQLGVGLGYDLGNGMMLSAQYRYFNTGAMDLSLADQAEMHIESHNFLIGLNVPIGGGN